jgi:hypothetical protein
MVSAFAQPAMKWFLRLLASDEMVSAFAQPAMKFVPDIFSLF